MLQEELAVLTVLYPIPVLMVVVDILSTLIDNEINNINETEQQVTRNN
jgi:hypothetical protein